MTDFIEFALITVLTWRYTHLEVLLLPFSCICTADRELKKSEAVLPVEMFFVNDVHPKQGM